LADDRAHAGLERIPGAGRANAWSLPQQRPDGRIAREPL
jgi:hypothetical protein